VRTIEFPQARIIYWEAGEHIPQKQTLVLKFPDGHCYNYEVENFNLLSHSVEELEERGMVILLPFYVLKMRKQVEAAATDIERKKLSVPLRKLLDELAATADACKQKGAIGTEDARDIIRGLDKLYCELYSPYKELAEEDSMLKEYLFEPTKNIVDRTRAEERLEIARNLLTLGDSPERVAKGTGLSLAKVKALLKTSKVKKSA
jgi:hypothetical protein